LSGRKILVLANIQFLKQVFTGAGCSEFTGAGCSEFTGADWSEIVRLELFWLYKCCCTRITIADLIHGGNSLRIVDWCHANTNPEQASMAEPGDIR